MYIYIYMNVYIYIYMYIDICKQPSSRRAAASLRTTPHARSPHTLNPAPWTLDPEP